MAGKDNGSGNYTSVFDFYQFWLNQADTAVEYLMKVYTVLEKDEVERIMAEQNEHPERRVAQKALAMGATEVVHGKANAEAVANLTERLFSGNLTELSEDEIMEFGEFLPCASKGVGLVEALVETGLVASKSEARKLAAAGAITVNGVKVTEDVPVAQVAILKRGKNKFAVVK